MTYSFQEQHNERKKQFKLVKSLKVLFTILCSPIILVSQEINVISDAKQISFKKQKWNIFSFPEANEVNWENNIFTYNLPDTHGESITLYRTNSSKQISIYTIIPIDNKTQQHWNYLKCRIKFSGSDIEEVKDTLEISTYSVKSIDSLNFSNLNIDIKTKSNSSIQITNINTHFEYYRIKLTPVNKLIDPKYLVIKISLVSGSDESFYYGISNATIDKLYID